MSGFPGDLSDVQTRKLVEFKSNIQDIWKSHFDDYFCCRWLRARNWDAQKAEKMVRDSMEWRHKNGIDTITTDWKVPEVLEKYVPGGFTGFDKEGGPVWIDCIGRIDLNSLFLAAKKSDIIKHKFYCIEKMIVAMEENNAKTGKTAKERLSIMDLDGVGYKHLWKTGLDVVLEITQLLEDHYPETLKATLVVNAPAIFPIVWNIVKPFLSEATLKKINVLGSDWKEKLQELIDPDQFPEHWGGAQKGEDGSPYGTVCIGGEMPESYFITKQFVDQSKFKTIKIEPGGSAKVDHGVQEGHVLSWQFWTEGYDIGFGVSRRVIGQTTPEDVVPVSRLNSHMVPEFDSITCDKTGIYCLMFDNSYSWMTGKSVSYSVEILAPDPAVQITAS